MSDEEYTQRLHETTVKGQREQDEYQDGRHYRQPETWTLTLNRYQRDNLLWLLQLVGGWPAGEAGDSAVEPFTFANSGDWLGEIAGMLGTQHWNESGPLYDIRFEPRRPNMSVDEIREMIDRWRQQWRQPD